MTPTGPRSTPVTPPSVVAAFGESDAMSGPSQEGAGGPAGYRSVGAASSGTTLAAEDAELCSKAKAMANRILTHTAISGADMIVIGLALDGFAARIEALSAEVAGWISGRRQKQLHDRLEQAEARAEALERDALRYRWLRDDELSPWAALRGKRPEDIDSAIDAALAAAPAGAGRDNA